MIARATLVALAIAVATPSRAQIAPSFNTVTIVVGFSPGQGPDLGAASDAASYIGQRLSNEPTYDDAARFIAANLGRHLPGRPRVIVQSRPGAASLVLARDFVGEAPRDGSVLAMLGPAAVQAPLLARAGALYDPRALLFVGALQRNVDLCVARGDAAVRRVDDLRRRETYVASLSPGSRSALYAQALNTLAGTRLRIVSGYGSSFEAARALETDEAEAWCGWTAASLRRRHAALLGEGAVTPLVQFASDAPDVTFNVPRAHDLPPDPVDRDAMRFIEGLAILSGFPLFAPPQTPPATMAQLRAAFEDMLRDPRALAMAARDGLDIDPVSGQELRHVVDDLAETSPAALARARDVYERR